MPNGIGDYFLLLFKNMEIMKVKYQKGYFCQQLKSKLEEINSGLNGAGEQISELEDRVVGTTAAEQEKERDRKLGQFKRPLG